MQGDGGNGTRSNSAAGIGGEGDYGLYEQHWNSDISFAMWQFWQANAHNHTDLLEHFEPALRGTADFWASRVKKGDDGYYHIAKVMPPDEYVDGVDDALFTNFGAVTIMRHSIAASKAAGRVPGANWSTVADKIFLAYDASKEYHPEYTGFVPHVKGSRPNAGGSTLVKQADVILIWFPYDASSMQGDPRGPMSEKVRANDLLIYGNDTDNDGPAMTWSMFAVGWLGVNDTKAHQNFLRGYSNIKPPFAVWTETPGGGTVNFVTGAGGFLQSVVFGYGGLRLREERLDLNVPPLPPDGVTTSITLNGIHYRGNKLRISISATTVSVELLAVETVSATALELCGATGAGAKPQLLDKGKTVHFERLSKSSIRPVGGCAVGLHVPVMSGSFETLGRRLKADDDDNTGPALRGGLSSASGIEPPHVPPPVPPIQVPLVLFPQDAGVESPANLDGSPYGVYLAKSPSGASKKWTVSIQGGGWWCVCALLFRQRHAPI